MKNSSINNNDSGVAVFKKGELIFAENSTNKHLFIVKKGEVHLVKSKGQFLKVLQICQSKDILNEVAIIMKKENEFSAFAKTDVELVLVDQKDIQSIMRNSPRWVSEIFSTLCERLTHTQHMIAEHNLDNDIDPRLSITKEVEMNYIQQLSND